MRLASLLFASLLTSLPAISVAQPAEAGGSVPPAPVAAAAPVAAPAAAPVAAPTAVPPAAKPEKNGPYVGVSFGTGKGTLYGGGTSLDIDQFLGLSGQAPTTLNMQLRAGWGTGDFLFGTQMNLTRSWVDVGGTSFGLQFFSVDLVATLWSQEMGLYSRVGVGPSQFSTYAGDQTSRTYSGVELMLGVGATLGGMGVGLDVLRQNYDANETGFDSVTYALATLSLDMY